MSKALGALAFVAGVAGLGYWGAKSQAVTIENKITQGAQAAIAGTVHPMDLHVAGRDITLSGTADTPDERDAVVAALNAVPGRRVVHAEGIEVLPNIDPYETAIAKGSDGALAWAGYAPSATRAATVPGSEALPLGHGAPEGWASAMTAGSAALAPLDVGSVSLTGTALTLSGTAATPAEDEAARAALGDLPGFDEVIAIDVTDPGVIDFSLSYDATAGYELNGTLPGNLEAQSVAQLLGLEALGGDLGTTFAELPGVDAILAKAGALVPILNGYTLYGTNAGVALTGDVMPGLDANVVLAEVTTALGGTVEVGLNEAAAPADGAKRRNAGTGAHQLAVNGAWLTLPEFEPTKAACTAAAMRSVDASPILFLTGSAELDPVSLATINTVAGILHICTADDGMRVEVGGHTDAQGDDTANYALSVARAKAVRDALIARGIAPAKLMAVGYGETEPVADNATEAGRAKNRRTTFAWPE